MDTVTDNLDEFEAHLRKLTDSFDFTSKGTGTNLAGVIVSTIVEGIARRSLDGQAGAGGGWEDNEKRYAKSKGDRPVGIGRRREGKEESGSGGSPMLSEVQLRGTVEVSPRALVMTYGTDDAARKKLEWFSNGSTGKDGEPSGAKNQPARPGLYATDAKIDADVEAAVADVLDEHIKDT